MKSVKARIQTSWRDIIKHGTCAALLPLLPAEKVFAVAEGGLGTAGNLEQMGKGTGAHGVETEEEPV